MRLKPFQVEMLCEKIVTHLKSQQLIEIKSGEPEVRSSMEREFIKELRVEDQINEEAERLLAQYERQLGQNIDREKMFQMIKKQLVKDKKVIL